MSKASATQAAGTVVLDADGAAKLAAGIKEMKLAVIREMLGKAGEIGKMPAELVEKLARLAEAAGGGGGCGIGCC